MKRYQSDFVDWKSYAANIEKAYQPMTIVQGQRIGDKTLYKESFRVPPKEKEESLIKTKIPKQLQMFLNSCL